MGMLSGSWIDKPEPEIVEIYVEHPEKKYTEEEMINFLEACTSTKHPYFSAYKNFIRANPDATSKQKLNWFLKYKK